MRKIKYFLGLILMLVTLTGCVKYNATMKINNDKSMEYSIIYAFDTSIFGDETVADEDEIKKVEENGYKVDEYVDGNYKGYKFTKAIDNIDSVSIEEAIEYDLSNLFEEEENQSIFKVEKSTFKNKYTANFKFSSDTSTEEDTTESDETIDMNGLTSSMEMTFSLTLPKEPISANADTISDDKKTLTWDLKNFSSDDSIKFEFELKNEIVKYLIIGGIALVGIIIIVAIFKKIFSNLENKNKFVDNKLN